MDFQVLLKQEQHTGLSSNKCTCFHSSSYCCFFESAGDTPPFCSLWPPRKFRALQNEAVVNCCHYSLFWSSSRYVISVYRIMFLCAYPFCLYFSIFAPTCHSQSVIFVMPRANCVISFETFHFKFREKLGEIWKMKRTSVGVNCFCEGRFYICFFSVLSCSFYRFSHEYDNSAISVGAFRRCRRRTWLKPTFYFHFDFVGRSKQ